MQQILINSIPIYQFSLDNDPLCDRILTAAESLDYEENKHNYFSVKPYYDPELFAWFDQCLGSVTDKYFSSKLRAVITAAWMNKTQRMGSHHRHVHSNAWISGVFYLTTHHSAQIEFSWPNPWLGHSETHNVITEHRTLKASNHSHYLTTAVPALKGQLLLFPSSLAHRVTVLKIQEPGFRYSLAFNAFLSGKFDNSDAGNSADLEITVRSLAETLAVAGSGPAKE